MKKFYILIAAAFLLLAPAQAHAEAWDSFTNTTTADGDEWAFYRSGTGMRNILSENIAVYVLAEDGEISSLAGLTSAADKVPYYTGSGTAALADLTAGGRALVNSAGTADTFPYFSASNTVTLGSVTAAGRALLDDAAASNQRATLGFRANEYCYALSDFNTTAVTAATSLAIEYLPAAFTVTGVRAYTRTAPTGAMTIDINEAGTTLMASTKLTIDANEKSSGTAATAAVVSDTAIAANAEVTIDVDSTTGGKGLVVCLEGTF